MSNTAARSNAPGNSQLIRSSPGSQNPRLGDFGIFPNRYIVNGVGSYRLDDASQKFLDNKRLAEAAKEQSNNNEPNYDWS